MLWAIVKNLQLKRCFERSLLLCSSHLSFSRGHAGASGHARIDSSPHPLKVLLNAASIRGRLLFPFAYCQARCQFEGGVHSNKYSSLIGCIMTANLAAKLVLVSDTALCDVERQCLWQSHNLVWLIQCEAILLSAHATWCNMQCRRYCIWKCMAKSEYSTLKSHAHRQVLNFWHELAS